MFIYQKTKCRSKYYYDRYHLGRVPHVTMPFSPKKAVDTTGWRERTTARDASPSLLPRRGVDKSHGFKLAIMLGTLGPLEFTVYMSEQN